MNADQLTKLIEATTTLVQALGWPLLVLFLAIYFGAPLKKFLSDVGEFSFKAGATGLEATAKRQTEAAVWLGAALGKPGDTSAPKPPPDEDKAREIANVVRQAVKRSEERRVG